MWTGWTTQVLWSAAPSSARVLDLTVDARATWPMVSCKADKSSSASHVGQAACARGGSTRTCSRARSSAWSPGHRETHLCPRSHVGCVLHYSSALTGDSSRTRLRVSRSSMIAFEDTAVLCERTAVSVFREPRTKLVGLQAAIDSLDWVGLCEERGDP
jgi:hypothetical protein